MKVLRMWLPPTDHRYMIFTACPDVLVINMNAPKHGKIIRLHYDRSKLPAATIEGLRRDARPI